MDHKTRKYNKPKHRKIPQNTRQLSVDVDESAEPREQSSSAETFNSNSNVSLKDQPDDHVKLLDSTQPLPEENSVNFVPLADPTARLSLSGSAIETNALIVEPDATGYQSLEIADKISRTDEHDLSSYDLTDVAAAAVGGSDNVFEGARERLMLQIDSLERDSEFIVPRNPTRAFEEFEPNFKLELGQEMSSTDTGNITLPYNDASHKVCQSQDATKLSEVEPLCSLAEADFFITENENLENFLKLLHHLKEICCHNGYYEHECQQQVCFKMVQQNKDSPQIGQDGQIVQANQSDTSSVQTTADYSEDSIQAMKEEIKQLMLSISKVLEKKQFSSVVELTRFLEFVEQMKVEIDQWCCIQNETRIASSKDSEDPTALDSTSGGARSFSDAIVFLRTKPSQIVTRLSESVVLWQDFIEIRAELEHELTLERYLLDSLQTNISYNEMPRTKLEAEHDLKLVEDKLEEYDDKLTSLRKCIRHLAELLDHGTLRSNREQAGILANELQDIKDSCSKFRSMLNPASYSDKMVLGTQRTNEKKNLFHSSCTQLEKSAEDFDKLPIARILLKMALLLFLIVLLFLFVAFFEPCWYRPLNRFRLPVPIHMRHVGTYPPI